MLHLKHLCGIGLKSWIFSTGNRWDLRFWIALALDQLWMGSLVKDSSVIWQGLNLELGPEFLLETSGGCIYFVDKNSDGPDCRFGGSRKIVSGLVPNRWRQNSFALGCWAIFMTRVTITFFLQFPYCIVRMMITFEGNFVMTASDL